MRKRMHLFVSGRVQGVYYRASTQKQALKLGLVGWVKNLADGRVELVAEGEDAILRDLRSWCEKGPKLAKVRGIDARWSLPTDEFTEFSVIR